MVPPSGGYALLMQPLEVHMETTTHTRTTPHSLLDLITGLREDVRTLFQQEANLAKTELSEKATYLGRHAIYLGIGGSVAYLALALFMIGLGYLLALAFEQLGLSTGLALFLGFSCIALVLGAVAGVFLVRALKAFSKTSLMPERTIATLKEIKQEGLGQKDFYRKQERPQESRSAEIKSDIDATRARIGYEVRGIRQRLRVARMTTQIASQLRSHPLRSVGIGLGTGAAGYVLMRITRIFGRRPA
jgi:ElaB/YqjD/DUF883 family membrane-anchored ribosome-binding protein